MRKTSKPAILLHGLKRSGNHAILNWIKSGDEFYFKNNALSFRRLHRLGKLDSKWHRAPRLSWHQRNLVSVEDMHVDPQLFRPGLFRRLPRNLVTAVAVRDPRNLFASRIRKSRRTTGPAFPLSMNEVMVRAIGLWKEHARICLEPPAGTIGIFFDRWLVDAGYRNAIAAKLAIAPDDGTLSTIASEGGGSSFDHADAEAVLDRASFLEPHERELLDDILSDPDLIALGRALHAVP